MPLDVDRLAAATLEGVKALLARELAPLRAANAALAAENAALAERLAAVEERDIAAELRPEIAGLAAAVRSLPAPVDFGPAIAEVRAAIPAPADLSGLATREELAAARAALEALSVESAGLAEAVRSQPAPVDFGPTIAEVRAAIPAPTDLSGLATREELAAAQAALEALSVESAGLAEAVRSQPAPVDFGPAIAEVRAAIPAPADLSGLATREELAAAQAALEALSIESAALAEALRSQPAPVDFGPAIAEVRAAIPAPADLTGFATREEVAAAMAGLPVPVDYSAPIEEIIDSIPGLVAAEVAGAMAALPPAPAGKDGKLPPVRAWTDAVHYEGEVVTHGGALWQAQRDTGREPGHEDWLCIAERGAPGRSVGVRGTYQPGGDYGVLDIVILDGSSFISLRDEPGPCPGEGWQLLASRGKTGKPAPREVRPEKDGGEIAGLYRDGEAVVLVLGDGREFRA